METGFNHLHSFLRWILLLLLVIAVVKSFNKNTYTEGNRKLNLFTMITAHIQLILGFSLYFMKGYYKLFGVEGAMGNAIQRFWMVEHLTGMLIAIILITIGHSKSKKGIDAPQKNKAIRTFYLIALIIILFTIPWPFKEGFEVYGWF